MRNYNNPFNSKEGTINFALSDCILKLNKGQIKICPLNCSRISFFFHFLLADHNFLSFLKKYLKASLSLIMDTYLAKIFSEIYQEDGMVVMGRGLGVEKLLVKLIRAYSLSLSTSRNAPLVFCINLNGLENSIIDLMLVDGVSPNLLPKVNNFMSTFLSF